MSRMGRYVQHIQEKEMHEKYYGSKDDKVVERAINLIFETLGDCPAGNQDYDKIDCENLCGTEGRDFNNCFKCWKDYFNDDSNFIKT